MEDYSQLGTQTLLVRQSLKEQAPVVESVASQNDLVLRFLEEGLHHRISVGGGNSRNVRSRDDEVGN